MSKGFSGFSGILHTDCTEVPWFSTRASISEFAKGIPTHTTRISAKEARLTLWPPQIRCFLLAFHDRCLLNWQFAAFSKIRGI